MAGVNVREDGSSLTVAVIGGGIAGIAAAVRLAEAGHRPIIIETRKKLGGRATSFVDPRTGEMLDNCQHVVMGCCTNLLDLYDRLGVLDRIEWHRTLYWADARGRIDVMKAGLLPAPFHLMRSLSRMKLLSGVEKRAIGRAMRAIMRIGIAGRQRWVNRTFNEFLIEQQQPQRAVDVFWNVIVVSACNMSVDRVGASFALQVFQEGFCAHRFAYVMGLPTVPLMELYDAAENVIRQAGASDDDDDAIIRLGESAKAIAFDGSRVTGVVTEHGVIEAAAIVSTVPFDRLDKLCSDTLKAADTRLQNLDRFEVSPILGVHLRFDQQVMDLPHVVLAECRTQWVFNKGVDAQGRQHLHAVISAADDWMPLDEAEIVERVLADIHRCIPRSVGLQPIEARSVKEKRATFAAVPGIDRYRPSAQPGTLGLGGGGVRNLYLAGDWCETGWPATMEGAARSGYLAAGALTGHDFLVPDLPIARLPRFLGLK